LGTREAQKEARRLSNRLKELGFSSVEVTKWWHHTNISDLGSRTPREAWLAGDYADVYLVADCV